MISGLKWVQTGKREAHIFRHQMEFSEVNGSNVLRPLTLMRICMYSPLLYNPCDNGFSSNNSRYWHPPLLSLGFFAREQTDLNWNADLLEHINFAHPDLIESLLRRQFPDGQLPEDPSSWQYNLQLRSIFERANEQRQFLKMTLASMRSDAKKPINWNELRH